MSKRLEKLGFKQNIRLEWIEYTLQMLLSDMNEKDIRSELVSFLENKKFSGGFGDRGQEACAFIVNMLVKTWVDPDDELIPLRNACLEYARENPRDNLILHWIMLGSAYPFWENCAGVFGKLFEFQEVIAKPQAIKRIKDIFGDRETVTRNARYVIRSFVAWEIIKDAEKIGQYIHGDPITISDDYLVSLLYEGIVMNTEKRQLPFSKIAASSSLFPFKFSRPVVEKVCKLNPRLEIISNAFNDPLVRIR